MSVIVPRTVTVVGRDRDRSASLEKFRSERAYVLLGDPGAGKTKAFETEAGADLGRSKLVTARRFIGRSLDHHPEWQGKTLFIDGLDEVRAGRPDARTPLDRILERLERLGRPDFRLSCRAADWLQGSDLREIMATAGYEDASVLQLDPLTDGNICRIVASLMEGNPDRFVDEANAQGLAGLLGNPHSLRLLVKATPADEWPTHRLRAIELACAKLARERNEEHRAVRRASPAVSTDRILAAAGQLSALLLLSDKEYVSQDETHDLDALCLGDISDGDQHALSRALKSNLFTVATCGSAPVHRQLAEFLGARYLSDRIKSGVPASRVLALMTGEDGGIVTELRGLSAWLAAFDRASRLALIEKDPTGTALYGDVSRFRHDEMESLFRAFSERAEDIQPWSWPPAALSSMIGPRAIKILNRYLADDDRREGRQVVVGMLLYALSRAGGVRACRENLERAVRDSTWQPWVRKSALHALVFHFGNGRSGIRTLVELLGDLKDGRVKDDDRELTGTLLTRLYPVDVTPEHIWDYLLPQVLLGSGGANALFWYIRLLEKTKKGHVVTLLQALTKHKASCLEHLPHSRGRDLVQKLVSEAMRIAGEATEVSTVYDWMELLDFAEADLARDRRAGHAAVTKWLAERPTLQKELALEGLRRHLRKAVPETLQDRTYLPWQVRWSVFGAATPVDFAKWSLRLAVEKAESDPELGRALLEWSRPWHEGDAGSGHSLEHVRALTAQVPVLQQAVESIVSAQRKDNARIEAMEMEFDGEAREYKKERLREKAEFIAYVREHVGQLSQGRCAPGLLHQIAVSYHDFFHKQRGIAPRQRVTEFLDGHVDLAEAAIEGFRRVVEREDLPTLRGIIRLEEQGKMSLLALPVLAGLDELGPEWLPSRTEPEIARAVAISYLTPLGVAGHPEWYRQALESHPEAVAKSLIKVTRSRIRGKRNCSHLYSLSRDADHRAVAQLAALPLLRAFPTRCTEPQVSALHEVLLAAVRWGVDGVEEFVRERVAKSDLDVAQRALWLAAGLCLSPKQYASLVVEFVGGGEEARSQHIVRFLAPGHMVRRRMPWGTPELKALIDLLGSRYSPWRPESFGVATVVDEDREKVEGLIASWAGTLASRTDVEACEALESLAENPALEAWRLILRKKRDKQVVARRTATFAVPELHSVQRTLADAEPSNPADLAALVADRFEQLGKQIRHGNTDNWQQYWNEAGHRRPDTPKHEGSCRNALLSDLRARLPDGVDAQPEALCARDNRADIRVSFGGHAIPVEIKKNTHPRLWSAAIDQLVAKYTIAPDSSGFGIYLVLWFGPERTPAAPMGRRPKTPEELQARLSKRLNGPYRHKVRVIVIDVTGSPNMGPQTTGVRP